MNLALTRARLRCLLLGHRFPAFVYGEVRCIHCSRPFRSRSDR